MNVFSFKEDIKNKTKKTMNQYYRYTNYLKVKSIMFSEEIVLSSNDDKRMQSIDSIETYALE